MKSLNKLLTAAAAMASLSLLSIPANAMVRPGDQTNGQKVRTITVYSVKNFAANGAPLGSWTTHQRPKAVGSCVSWQQDEDKKLFTVCGGTTHIQEREEQLLQIQKD